jgi:hypothetical protein
MCSLRFQFNYSRTIGKTPRSLLIWHSLIVNMTSFLQGCDDILVIEFLIHWCFDVLCYFIDLFDTLDS